MKKRSLIKFALAVTMLPLANAAHAQLVDCNAFLSGNYIQAGISPNGAFGTTTTAPTGYYVNAGSAPLNICDSSVMTGFQLGFISDPAMDGFTVGSPAYYGDFFTPGSPFEGWSISVDGVRADAFGTAYGACTGGMTGSNIGYTATASGVQTTWQGMFNGVSITQVTNLDSSALFFSMSVTITNTDTVAHDIYYLRTLDPDNDEVESGSFSTKNQILYQLPNPLNASVVTATGTVYDSAFLALGSGDTSAKCFIYSSWPISNSIPLGDLYADTAIGGLGTSAYGMGDSIISDVAIGLVFNVGHLASVDSAGDSVANRTTSSYHPANSKTVNYFYAFGAPAVNSALSTATPTAVNNISKKPITIFPNPTTNNLTINGLNPGDVVTLYNMMGAQVNIGTANSNNYSLSTIPTGNYIILIKDAQGNVRKKQTISKL